VSHCNGPAIVRVKAAIFGSKLIRTKEKTQHCWGLPSIAPGGAGGVLNSRRGKPVPRDRSPNRVRVRWLAVLLASLVLSASQYQPTGPHHLLRKLRATKRL